MKNKFSAYKIYLLYSGVTSLLFWMAFTVTMVYQVETVKLNPLQIVLVGTTLEAVCFIFEIPTGIVADIYSRKLSIIIGIVLIGTGFTFEGLIPHFTAIIASQVLWGIGSTFTSGAVEAWVVEEERTKEPDEIFLRGSQAGQAGAVIGIIAGTVTGNFSISLPIVISGISFLLFSLLLIPVMPEDNFKSSSLESLGVIGKMGHTFRKGLKAVKKKRVALLLCITLFYGLSSEGYDRLSTAHFLKDTVMPVFLNLKPVTWFGIFGISGMLISAAAMQLIIKRFERNSRMNNAWILLTINIFYILGVIFFAVTENFGLMVVSYLTANMVRTVNGPVFDAWLNRSIDDSARATVLSANGQINSLGQIIGGPVIGVLASRYSVGIGILCAAFLLVPVVGLYIWAGIRYGE